LDLHDYKDVAQNYDLYVKEIDKEREEMSEEKVVNFHNELAEKYGERGVLDIGCGTGITLIPLIKKGYSVTGVDISQPMINIVNEKLNKLPNKISSRADTICAGMEAFESKQNYSLAIIPRTGFMHILDKKIQRKALLNIKDHLYKGGILSLNTFYPNHEILANQIESQETDFFHRFTYTNSDGNREKVYNSATYNPETQIMSGKWLFKEYNENDEVISERERPLKLRCTFKNEMEYLFEICGFKIKELYGSYSKTEPEYPGSLIWVVEKE
jgi:SAM-dependent methyltransferase